MDTLNVKAGDVVAVLLVDRNSKEWPSPYKPNRLQKVVKVTPKQIFIGGDARYDLCGHPVGRYSSSSRITADPAIIAELTEQMERRRQERADQERASLERDLRVTYQLACELYRPYNTDLAIADLELLGEDYLRRILADIEKAKENVS